MSYDEILKLPEAKALLLKAGGALIVGLGTAIFATWKLAKKYGYQAGLKEIRNEYQKQQYEFVYSKLYLLFCNDPIETSSAIVFPEFKHRLKEAIKKLRLSRYRASFFALFDKGIHQTSGMAFGQPFPLQEVKRIIQQYPHLCGKNLLDHFSYINYDSCDSEFGRRADELSYSQEQFVNYITDKYIKLHRKFVD